MHIDTIVQCCPINQNMVEGEVEIVKVLMTILIEIRYPPVGTSAPEFCALTFSSSSENVIAC